MLSIIRSLAPLNLHELLPLFDPRNGTLVVSDLYYKSKLVDYFLSSIGYVEDDWVMRTHELWTRSFAKLYPHYQLVDPAVLNTLVLDFCQSGQGLPDSSSRTISGFLNHLIPILIATDLDKQTEPSFGPAALEEFFAQYPSAAIRWQIWTEFAQKAWKFLAEKKIISSDWAVHFLLEHPKLKDLFTRPLFFDVNVHLKRAEAELIRTLSRNLEVQVVSPQPSAKYSHTLSSYDWLWDQANIRNPINNIPLSSTDPLSCSTNPQRTIQCLRFASELGEIKHLTAQVRHLIERKVEPKNIVVVAPNIEGFWPTLSLHMVNEGIICKKARVTKLHTFPEVQKFLARLRTEIGLIQSSDFQTVIEQQNKRSELVHALTENIYQKSDMDRVLHLYTPKSFDANKIISFTEYFSLCFDKQENLSSALQTLFTKLATIGNLQFRFPIWVSLTETFASQIEIEIASEYQEGIRVLSLYHAANCDAQYRFYLGLSEDNLQPKTQPQISPQDAEVLLRDYGFFLPHPDQNELEYLLRWNLLRAHSSHFLYTSNISLLGSPQAPSIVWLETAKENNQENSEENIQENNLKHHQEKNIKKSAALEALTTPYKTCFDFIALSGSNFQLETLPYTSANTLPNTFSLSRLSASSIEAYLKCPFIFAATKVFRLQDLPEVDLDPDHRTKGSFAHRLFELLTHKTKNIAPSAICSALSSAEIVSLCDQIRQESKLHTPLELWPVTRATWVSLAERFLQYQSNYKSRFPSLTETITEQEFLVHFDTEICEFVDMPNSNSIMISGSIDRIDLDHNRNAVVIDYKPSPASATNFTHWTTKGQVQLALYTMILEQGLPNLSPLKVAAAHYLVYRNFQKGWGFQCEEHSPTLFESAGLKKNKIDSEGKKQLFESTKKLLSNVAKNIRSQNFEPKPLDENSCTHCKWRQLCRAKHLS